MPWIDAHIHLTDPRLFENRLAELDAARAVGIDGWVSGGVDPRDWGRQRELRREMGESIRLCFGIHPWWIANAPQEEIQKAIPLLESIASEADAIGETGLDRARGRERLESYPLQRELFERQIALAKALHKPLVLHIVWAHAEALELLKRFSPFPAGGLVHAFSEGIEIARCYRDLGLLISVGAEGTRAGEKLARTVRELDPEGLVVETDAPDQAPFSNGKRISELNRPCFLVDMADAIGRIRGVPRDEVLDQSTQNLRKLFSHE